MILSHQCFVGWLVQGLKNITEEPTTLLCGQELTTLDTLFTSSCDGICKQIFLPLKYYGNKVLLTHKHTSLGKKNISIITEKNFRDCPEINLSLSFHKQARQKISVKVFQKKKKKEMI